MKTILTIILVGIACNFCAHVQQYQMVLEKVSTWLVSLELNKVHEGAWS